MSEEAFCGTCPFMERDDNNLASTWCRRYPPTVVPIGPGQVTGFLVPVHSVHGWCGEHPGRRLETSVERSLTPGRTNDEHEATLVDSDLGNSR